MNPPPPVSPVDLRALATKYRTLASMRRAKARGEPEPDRSVFRDLARAFPGSLRELETLHLDLLDGRADALERASIDSNYVEGWMGVVADYHHFFRVALAMKSRSEVPIAVDAEFTRQLVNPPNGRMRNVVVAKIATRHGRSVDQIRAILFPPRERTTLSPDA
jgi:hypothetical protein